MKVGVPSLTPGYNSLPPEYRGSWNGVTRLAMQQHSDSVPAVIGPLPPEPLLPIENLIAQVPTNVILWLDTYYPGWREDLQFGNIPGPIVQWLDQHRPGWKAQLGLSGLGDWVCPDPTNPDTCYDDGSSSGSCLFGVDSTGQCLSVQEVSPGYTPPAGYSGPTSVPVGTKPPVAPSGYQWATLINQSGQQLAQILAISQGGSSIRLPNGNQLIFGSPQSAAYGAAGYAGGQIGSGLFSGSTGTLLVVGGLAVLLLLAGGRR